MLLLMVPAISYAAAPEAKTMGILQSESRSFSGTVTDEAGQPIVGATVALVSRVSGQIITGAYSDALGNFTVSTRSNEPLTLRITFNGYETVSQDVQGSQSGINATMRLVGVDVDEVLITAYGQQQRVAITGSVAQISGEEVASLPVQSFDQALQGRATGVQIGQAGGELNAPVNIRIRGTNTLTSGGNPLIVVDGIPISDLNFAFQKTTNVLNDINPADIESYEILKDGAALALYGSRGANGVILITTKRGRQGTAQVSYDGFVGLIQPVRVLDVLNGRDFETIMNESDANAGNGGPFYTPSDVDGDGQPDDTDWQDLVYNNAFIHQHNISISGGTEKTQFYGSVGYSDSEGIIITNRWKRYSARLNMDHQATDWLRLGVSFGYVRNQTNDLSRTETAFNSVPWNAIMQYPNASAYFPDGSYNIIAGVASRINHPGNARNLVFAMPNILHLTENNVELTTQNRVIANAYARVTPVQGLSFQTKYSIDKLSNIDYQYWNPLSDGVGIPLGGVTQNQWGENVVWNWSNTVEYGRTFAEQHTVSVLAGLEWQFRDRDEIYAGAAGFSDPFFTNLSGAYSQQFVGGVNVQQGFSSYFARLNYNFAEKYYLEASFRSDATSDLNEENRRGYFPGVSVGWRITQEDFFNVPIFDELKLRASFGSIGNINIGNWPYLGGYGGGNYGDIGGSSYTAPSNESLLWEIAETWDVGVDAVMLDSRLQVIMDYYIQNNTDIILTAPTRSSAGVPGDALAQNIGTIKNSGFEIAVNYSPILQPDGLRWDVGLNFTAQKTEVTELFGDGSILDNGAWVTEEGRSIGEWYLYEWNGVNPQTGDPTWIKGDGSYVEYNQVTGQWLDADGNITTALNNVDDRKYFGQSRPTWFGSLTNTLNYKNFDFTLFMTFQGGNKIYNQTRSRNTRFDYSSNKLSEVMNRWTEVGQVTDVPRVVFGSFDANNASSRFLEDGWYIRASQIQLGYRLPQSILQTLGMTKFRVYVNVQNAFVITDYTGVDPDISRNGRVNITQGEDQNSVPFTRTLSLGVQIGL